jgi:hypothetical protein
LLKIVEGNIIKFAEMIDIVSFKARACSAWSWEAASFYCWLYRPTILITQTL